MSNQCESNQDNCESSVCDSHYDHLNTISNEELSDPLCDSLNRGLTLGRLGLANTYFIDVHQSICRTMRRNY